MPKTFQSDGEEKEPTVKVKQDDANLSKVKGDKYTPTEKKGEHVHESYKLDTDTGKYSQYSGGEKSDDRSYNKPKPAKTKKES